MNEARRLYLRERLTAGLWFIPAVWVAGAVSLALGVVALDRRLDGRVPAVLELTAAGSRAVLATVGASMLGVMGTVLSMTVISLMLASTSMTPRALGTFTRDRGTQHVIGVFTAAFVYSMLVLRVIRDKDEGGPFIAPLAVSVALLAGLAGVAALIYFTHHVATSMRVINVVSRTAALAGPLLERAFTTTTGRPLPAPAGAGVGGAPPGADAGAPVPAAETGYVQAIDIDALFALAGRHDCVVHMARAVGEFAARGEALVRVAPAARLTPALERGLRHAYVLGADRSLLQDPEYGVRQIADIGVKAISPGLSDPTTALSCLDYLTPLLAGVAGRADPPPYRGDDAGRLRLVARGPTFDTVVARTLDHFRQKLGGEAEVTLRLLALLATVAEAASADPRRRQVLWEHGRRVVGAADRQLLGESDRAALNYRVRRLAAATGHDPAEVLLATRPPATA